MWICSILLIFLLPLPGLAGQELKMDARQWRLASEGDGICLYSCHVKGTGIVPFKAVMTIPASIEEISAVLEDISRRGQWIVRFGESRLLERKNDYDQVEYLRMVMPWPLQDRTAIVGVKIRISEDLKTATIAGSSLSSSAGADLPELVRAQIYESTFQMQITPAGTEVTALFFIDPRGNLPQWAVNLYTRRVSRRTLENLRRQVAKKLYGKQALEALRLRILNYASFSKGLGN